ncbi:hypothetical protein KC721_02700, partial [Candidatus Woesebacteria bacterium]|nr:hypothetical protein [Candidatus Woesebacteria bacterium]
QINEKALELLQAHPEGVRWSEMLKLLQEAFPDFHPKTINGTVWKLLEKYPDTVEKPEKGLFRLKKKQA